MSVHRGMPCGFLSLKHHVVMFLSLSIPNHRIVGNRPEGAEDRIVAVLPHIQQYLFLMF